MLFGKLANIESSCVVRGIRDAFKRSKRYQLAMKKARTTKERTNKDGSISKKPDVYFKCNMCGKLYKRKEVQLDHIQPVIPIQTTLKNLTLDEYIDNIYKHDLQVLCKTCHKSKTKEERKLRK